MAQNVNNLATGDLGGLPIDTLLPERPAIIGEFSPPTRRSRLRRFPTWSQ